jgi:hypothetical protein
MFFKPFALEKIGLTVEYLRSKSSSEMVFSTILLSGDVPITQIRARNEGSYDWLAFRRLFLHFYKLALA